VGPPLASSRMDRNPEGASVTRGSRSEQNDCARAVEAMRSKAVAVTPTHQALRIILNPFSFSDAERGRWVSLRAIGSLPNSSPYAGGRTLKWLKVKQADYRESERGWEPQKS
jgi:hypothetical protein